jgi:DNA repair protein RAD50
MLVVRSFQLTQKNKKLEFKQLESAIQTKNEKNEVVSHSYRCSDMDKLVPEMMGVSKSILENVIFCHQEGFIFII